MPSKSGRSALGLGQSDYSASLGLLGRSQSVKQTSIAGGRRMASVGGDGGRGPVRGPMSPSIGVEEEHEFEEYGHDESEYEEGSVIKNPQVEDEDDEDEDGLSKKIKAYPGLGLDFGSNVAPSSRSVSGVSSMA